MDKKSGWCDRNNLKNSFFRAGDKMNNTITIVEVNVSDDKYDFKSCIFTALAEAENELSSI